MPAITIGFSTDPTSRVSRIIRWFTKSKCSHSFITLEDSMLGKIVVESDAGGVQVVMWDRFHSPGNTLVHEVEVTSEFALPALKQAMTECLNEAYDYSGVIGMAWVMLWRRLKKRVRNPFHSSKARFCSNFVTRYLQILNDLAQKAGAALVYPGTDKLTPEDTNAQDVWDFLDGKPVET